MHVELLNQFIAKHHYPEFNLKGVFFDMDGVLYDSMKFHASAWVNALNDMGLAFTTSEAYMNEGRTGHSTIDSVFLREFQRTATEKEKQAIYQQKTIHFESYGAIEAMPYALELLQLVQHQRLQISVVTGSAQASLIKNLETHFPGFFSKEHIVSAFDVTHGKPHPEPYLKALRKSGLKPWEVVVIENAPLGVQAAVAAGLFTIGVNTGPLDTQVLIDSGCQLAFSGGMKELFSQWKHFSSLSTQATNPQTLCQSS